MNLFTLLLFLLAAQTQAASHHPEDFLKEISGSKHEGQAIVTHFCMNCHAAKPIIPLGAPRINEEADWKPRLKQGLSQLFKHTSEGFNAMPPRGGCFECSDKQLMLALMAMIPESFKKCLKENKLDTLRSKKQQKDKKIIKKS